MTREEILSKEVLRGADIMELFGVKRNTACSIIKSIKECSDMLHIRGLVHIRDYNTWLEMRAAREAERRVRGPRK